MNICHECKKYTKCKRCSACQDVYYCSVDCQKKDYPQHKLKCGKSNWADDGRSFHHQMYNSGTLIADKKYHNLATNKIISEIELLGYEDVRKIYIQFKSISILGDKNAKKRAKMVSKTFDAKYDSIDSSVWISFSHSDFSRINKIIDCINSIEQIYPFSIIEDIRKQLGVPMTIEPHLEKIYHSKNMVQQLDNYFAIGYQDIYQQMGYYCRDNVDLDKTIELFNFHIEYNKHLSQSNIDEVKYEIGNIYLSRGETKKALEIFFSIKDPDISNITNKIFWNHLGKDSQEKPFIRLDLDTLIKLCENC